MKGPLYPAFLLNYWNYDMAKQVNMKFLYFMVISYKRKKIHNFDRNFK